MKKYIVFSQQEKIFLGAIFVSVCGDALVPTAFALESLRIDSTGSGFTLVLLALWGGRFIGALLFRKFPSLNLKYSMIGADIVRLLAQIGLSIWIFLVAESTAAMSISSLVYGVATAFFMPSRFAVTPEVVSEENLKRFNSITNLTTDSLMIVSPAISTAAFLHFGFIPILIFDAVTFALGIFFLCLIKTHSGNPSLSEDPDASGSNSANDVKALPRWAALGIVVWSLITLIVGYSGVAGPFFIINRFSPTDWAIVSTALAAGSIIGSAGQLTGIFQKISWKTLQIIAGALISLQIILFATSSSLSPIVLSAFSAATVMTSAGISWDTVIQRRLNKHNLRIYSNLDSFLTTGTVPLGMIIFGLGTLLNSQVFVTVIIASLCIISLVPFFAVSKNISTDIGESSATYNSLSNTR